VDVITGVIKANMPSRIAFAVSSGVDSRTILDMNGADKLLGKGDKLYYPQGKSRPERIQGGFVSDEEISEVIEFLKERAGDATYDEEAQAQIEQASANGEQGGGGSSKEDDGRDEFFFQAAELIIDKDKASIGMLQRYFKIGFNRAARLMDQLADARIVGEEEGTKPRKILMTKDQLMELM
ncbi:MAG: DNA translocase FtsK, partial [Lachnospiraceae bacterium]|nr:DNA translocase FtsK [Lachnospiraceae bacterium]